MNDEPQRIGAWAPLRIAAFRTLFFGMIAGNIGLWAQMVGAQWILVDQPRGASLAALLQTAMTLPFALFSLPAGILADSRDRRRLLIQVQWATVAVAVVLAVSVAAGWITPYLLLALTFVIGAAGAMGTIPFQSVTADLVPRSHIPVAAAMNGISGNIARAIGPAIAGALIASFGIPSAFYAFVVGAAVYLVALIMWRRPPETDRIATETFLGAFRSGTRYVRHSPHIRNLLLRHVFFTVPSQGIFALLPVVAKRQLGVDVGQYGLLFGGIGIGAVIGATLMPRIRERFGTNGSTIVAFLSYALATVGLALSHSLIPAFLAMLIAGFGWLGALTTIGGSLQLYLPAWVRSRGIAVNFIALFAAQAIGAAIWGWLAELMTLPQALAISAAIILFGVLVSLRRPLIETADLDRRPAQYWPNIEPLVDPHADAAGVQVTIEYAIAHENVEAFYDAMRFVRIVRLRTGGYHWRLHRDVENPERFVESYAVGTWAEHMLQHEHRLVESDREIETRAKELSHRPLIVQHYIEASVRKL